MNDTGYTTLPVTELGTADLLGEAEQSGFDSGYYAGVLNQGALWSEYEPLLTRARDRRNECFAELRRRLEAAEALVTERNLLREDGKTLADVAEVVSHSPMYGGKYEVSPETMSSVREALRGWKEATNG